MSFIYVTGAPGIGKTTLQKEFMKRGYDARDIDNSSLGGPHNKDTGKLVIIPPALRRTSEWFDAHEWRVYPDAFEKLKTETSDKDILIFGVAATDTEILVLFDKIMYLNIDDEILAQRIKNRKENDYGQNEFELEKIFNRKRALDEKYKKLTTIHIDAGKTVNEVTRQIISFI